MLKKNLLKFFFFIILGAALLSVYEVFLRYLGGTDFNDNLYSVSWWWEFYKVFALIICVSYLLSLLIKDWGFWITASVLCAVFIDLIVISRVGDVSGLNLAIPLAWYYIYTLGLIRIFAEFLNGTLSSVPKWAPWTFTGFLGFDLLIKFLIYSNILPNVNFVIF